MAPPHLEFTPHVRLTCKTRADDGEALDDRASPSRRMAYDGRASYCHGKCMGAVAAICLLFAPESGIADIAIGLQRAPRARITHQRLHVCAVCASARHAGCG